MKIIWTFGFILVFCSSVWAADIAPQKINRPYFLRVKDKTPNDSLTAPTGSVEDAHGRSLDTDVNITPPDAATMDRLSDPVLFETIRKTKSTETDVNRFYWHASGDLDYCHYQDAEGNHWYVWSDDGGFNWILSRGHRYWWHDPFGKHWLYYYQGYWWRADGQTKNSIQVCMDGEYYACDSQGHVVTDMGEDGNGNIMSAPGRYRGDSHHGGHGNGGGTEPKVNLPRVPRKVPPHPVPNPETKL
jgi:hypothetical protein